MQDKGAASTGHTAINNAKIHKAEEKTKEDDVATSSLSTSPGLSFFSLFMSWLVWVLVLLLAVTATLPFSLDATPDQSGMETFLGLLW